MTLLDTGIRLELPYNHDERYAEWLAEHVEGVWGVYFPVHGSLAPSARVWTDTREKAAYDEEMKLLASVLNRYQLEANVVLNAGIHRHQWPELGHEIARLTEVFERLIVTVVDFAFARHLHSELSQLRFGVSTIADLGSPDAASLWLDALPIESVVISRRINKRPEAIRSIKALGPRIKMVLDDRCIANCPARFSHMVVHTEANPGDQDWCAMEDFRAEKPWFTAQQDVVPATLPLYDGIVDVGKIEGRCRPLEDIERKIGLYLKAQSFEHPNQMYVEPVEAFERIVNCDRMCASCQWCPNHFRWGEDDDSPAAEDNTTDTQLEPTAVSEPADETQTPAGPRLGLVEPRPGDGPRKLVLEVCFEDTTLRPCLIEVAPLESLPHPFVRGMDLGVVFRGRNDDFTQEQLQSIEGAAKALMRLSAGQGRSLDALLRSIESAGLTRYAAERPWLIGTGGTPVDG